MNKTTELTPPLSVRLDRRVSRLSMVCCGLGTNTAGMLAGMAERGEVPDAIVFADTGGEDPRTYKFREILSAWCVSVGFPPITTVRANGKTLEQDCLDRHALPSLAYGFKTCSLRWKKDPQDKWARENGFRDAVRLIGIDRKSTRLNSSH